MYFPEKPKDSTPLLFKVTFIFAGILSGFLLSRIFIFPFMVSDNAMQPNFSSGQTLLVARFSTPQKGDVVLIKSPLEPDRLLLKRIIAVDGDSLEIKNKIFYINKASSSFQWKTITTDSRIFPMSFSFRDNMPTIKLKKGEYFVIGDNHDYSTDSRTFGKITRKDIKGKVFYSF